MTITITGGLVSIEDGVKKAEEYAPPRKVRVELKFDVAEGQDAEAITRGVSAMASNQVAELLGSKPLISNVVVATAAAAEPEKRGPGRPSTKKPAAAETPATITTPSQVVDVTNAAAVVDTPAETIIVTDPPAGDELDAILGLTVAEVVKEITDAELNAAVQKKNAALQDPPMIRDLITKFQPDPAKPTLLANIAQDQRAAFLTDLEKLKK